MVRDQPHASAVIITTEQETWVGPKSYLHKPFGEEINLSLQETELSFLGRPADDIQRHIKWVPGAKTAGA